MLNHCHEDWVILCVAPTEYAPAVLIDVKARVLILLSAIADAFLKEIAPIIHFVVHFIPNVTSSTAGLVAWFFGFTGL